MLIDFSDQIILLPLLRERDGLRYSLSRYAASPEPTADMAKAAFDSEWNQLEDRYDRVCRILKRRYNL